MRRRKQGDEKFSPKRYVSDLEHPVRSQNVSDGNKCEQTLKNGWDSNVIVNEKLKVTQLDNAGGKVCGVNLVGVLKVIILVILVPPFLNYASLQKEFRSLFPHGGLLAAPLGHKLFINCSGKGQPVVVMDTPGGCSSDIWSLVQLQLAKFTKVCVYDRKGLGFSESFLGHAHSQQWNNSGPREEEDMRKRLQPTTQNMVDDLRYMLKSISHDTSAVILVGGGLGAVNVRFYTRMYEDVFGLVLINSWYEGMFKQRNTAWDKFWYEHFIPSLQIQRILAMLGVTRLGLLSGFIKPEVLLDTRLAHNVKTRLKYLLCNSNHLTSGISELYYINESLAQLNILRKLKPFPGNVSVKIISSEKFSYRLTSPLNDFWRQNQELLINKVFPHSERVFVRGDFVKVYVDDAEIIVRTIRKLVQKFRKSVRRTANI